MVKAARSRWLPSHRQCSDKRCEVWPLPYLPVFVQCQQGTVLVSHKLLPGKMERVGASHQQSQLVVSAATKWAMQYEIRMGKTVCRSTPVAYWRRLFQGDSLVSVLFVLATSTMGYVLDRESKGYRLCSGETVKYLLYVDDLKVYALSETDIKQTGWPLAWEWNWDIPSVLTLRW